jgi:hypothetical protein
MGAHPYWYFVPYKENIQEALDDLRNREFAAGRYNPVTPFPSFPVTDDEINSNAEYGSIVEAREAAAEEGTRSILDLDRIAATADIFALTALDKDSLFDLYDTDCPTRDQVEEKMGFLEDVERGQGIYIVIYEDNLPSEILFSGYSFD